MKNFNNILERLAHYNEKKVLKNIYNLKHNRAYKMVYKGQTNTDEIWFFITKKDDVFFTTYSEEELNLNRKMSLRIDVYGHHQAFTNPIGFLRFHKTENIIIPVTIYDLIYLKRFDESCVKKFISYIRDNRMFSAI